MTGKTYWFGKLKSYLEIGRLVPNGSYTESAASTILNAKKAAKRCRHTELRTRYEIRLKCKWVKYWKTIIHLSHSKFQFTKVYHSGFTHTSLPLYCLSASLLLWNLWTSSYNRPQLQPASVNFYFNGIMENKTGCILLHQLQPIV